MKFEHRFTVIKLKSIINILENCENDLNCSADDYLFLIKHIEKIEKKIDTLSISSIQMNLKKASNKELRQLFDLTNLEETNSDR